MNPVAPVTKTVWGLSTACKGNTSRGAVRTRR